MDHPMQKNLAPSPLTAILASIQTLAASLFLLREREIKRSDLPLRWEIQAACIRLVEGMERLIYLSDDGRGPHCCADAVAQYVLARFREPEQEVVGALYLDPECRLLAAAEHFRGTLGQAAAEDIALEMSRLDKRLGKIRRPEGAALLADSPLEIELPDRIRHLRQERLQPGVLEILELAQMAGTTRLETAAAQSTEHREARGGSR
jgi:hypothetical protein